MSVTIYRGVVKGKTVVLLDEAAALPEGTEVMVTPVVPERGSMAALLTAMESAPYVPTEWVDELERLIDEGKRPPVMPERGSPATVLAALETLPPLTPEAIEEWEKALAPCCSSLRPAQVSDGRKKKVSRKGAKTQRKERKA